MIIMKTFIFLCCTMVFGLTPDNILSQNSKIKIEKNTILSVDEVFDLIMDQTDYRFFYEEGIFEDFPGVKVKKGVVKTNKLLKRCLINGNLDIKVTKNNAVIIKEKPIKTVPDEQQYEVSGNVTDQSGQPLTSASIIEKGTTNGAVSDFDGKFSLTVSDKNATLVISYLGYLTNEVALNGQSTLSITLQEDKAKLDEVVVVGYGTQKKSSLTSSITSVDTDKMEGRLTANLTGALQGLTPGLYIRQTSGRPGSGPWTVDIRGGARGTFSSNNALIIIDGIPSDFNSVNPDDVENISILKDAAAASIYGARASGGVILITTKKGKEGEIKVRYSSQIGFQSSSVLNNIDFINTEDYMNLQNQAAQNDALATGNPYNAVWNDEQINDARSDGGEYPSKSEWTDWIPERVPMHNHNLTLSGGSGNLNYYTSLGYLNQKGILPKDFYDRKSFQLNLDYKVSSKANVALQLGYINQERDNPNANAGVGYAGLLRSALLTDPTKRFRFENGEYNNDSWAFGRVNPVLALNEAGSNTSTDDTFRGSLAFDYEIIDGLKLKTLVGGRSTIVNFNNIQKKIPLYNEDGSFFKYNTGRVSVSEGFSKNLYVNSFVSLDYTKKINSHSVYAMIGYTTEAERSDFLRGSASNYLNNELRELDGFIGSGDDESVSGNAQEWALASTIGKFAYNYEDKYFVETSFRYDGSSRISPIDRYGFFPSVSAAWTISKESFVENISFISNLKLRASWGVLGNQGSNLYPFAEILGVNQSSGSFGTSLVTGITTGTPVDLFLKWEEKTSKNIGLDFGYLNYRLTGSIDFFSDLTEGILTRPTAPPQFGGSAPIQNAWSIRVKGYEFAVNWRDQIGGLAYSVGFNISDAKDEIVDYDDVTDVANLDFPARRTGNTYLAEGHPRNELFGYLTDGLYVDQAEIDGDDFARAGVRPGEVRYLDVNGDGVVNGNDRAPLGESSTAHHIYGINLTAEYKGFDLSAVFNGVVSRWDFRQLDGTYLHGYRPGPSILRSTFDKMWTLENPDKNAKWSRVTNQFNRLFGGFNQFGRPSQYELRNYAYLRLKNLQIGYTLPAAVLSKLKVEKLRIYFTGENLLTIANGFDEPLDPEATANTRTGDGQVYLSNLMSMSIGIALTF